MSSGRPARLGAAVGLAVLVGAAGLALADRLPSETRPRPSMPVSLGSPTPGPVATPTPPATPTVFGPPSALDRGNGWPPSPRPDTSAHFGLNLLSYQLVLDRVHLSHTASEAAARLAVPAATWHAPAWLQLRWHAGPDDATGQQLAMVGLSLGSSESLGLPIQLARGHALLPQPLGGTRHWDYAIWLERAHDFSTPSDWIAVIRLNAAAGPPPRPASQAAPMILLTASPGHPQRASRVHGTSWVAAR